MSIRLNNVSGEADRSGRVRSSDRLERVEGQARACQLHVQRRLDAAHPRRNRHHLQVQRDGTETSGHVRAILFL